MFGRKNLQEQINGIRTGVQRLSLDSQDTRTKQLARLNSKIDVICKKLAGIEQFLKIQYVHIEAKDEYKPIKKGR
jgi:hypothetical protein